ncbi:MAG: hypothetical protein DRJ55_03965 [Thermoprotei archaeon]|nr:MAG: hypothetical protein DRJ55_03965 [Thermoprotei archaeon]
MTAGIKLLDPREVKVIGGGIDTVDITIGRNRYFNVTPRRPFPLSHPEVIVFYDQDENEIGVIEDYRKLDRESRKKLEKVLNTIYYIPRIKRIEKIEQKEKRYVWTIVLEKVGKTEIETWSKCVKIMPDGKIFMKDIKGQIFTVDISKLDQKSRTFLGTMI